MKSTTLALLGAVGLSTVAIAQTTPQTIPGNNTTNSIDEPTTAPTTTAPSTTAPTTTAPAPTETPDTTEATTATPDQSMANETQAPPKSR